MNNINNLSAIITLVLASFTIPAIFAKLENFYLLSEWRESFGNRVFIHHSTSIKKTWGGWIVSSLNFFDRIFGKKHFSFRCLGRSAIFTLLFTGLSLLLIDIFYGKENFYVIYDIIFTKENIKWLILALVINIFIDYFSLLETRYVLGFIAQDHRLSKIFILLIMDLLFSFFIFIVMFSIAKATIDFLLLTPSYYKYNSIQINHGHLISVSIENSKGYIYNLSAYFISVIKYTFLSCYEIINSSLKEYWFSSFYLSSEKKYVMHGSTMWLTTHFSSIFIYIYLSFILLGKISFLHRFPLSKKWYTGLFLIPKHQRNAIQIKYPITIIVTHLLFYIVIGFIFCKCL